MQRGAAENILRAQEQQREGEKVQNREEKWDAPDLDSGFKLHVRPLSLSSKIEVIPGSTFLTNRSDPGSNPQNDPIFG